MTLGEVNAALRYFARPQATAVVALPISSGDAVAGANGVPSPEPTGR